MSSLPNIKIGRFTLGDQCRPFIVAEMSGNHNQSLDRALEIVDAAAESGAHAIKLQTYTADSMTLDLKTGPYFITDPKSLWSGRSLYELYQEAATPYEWHQPIMERARAKGLECFSTPFSEDAVDFLESLDVPCYKIASFENIDLPLIRKVARTGKPMIISTGMASLAEIDDAVNVARDEGLKDLILLKCTSSYPASPKDTNIRTIPHMRSAFGVHVGLSDHTMGVGVSVASVALGAIFIEKHFTLSRADGGVDSAFSLEPAELKALVVETERAWQGLGEISYRPTESEIKSKIYRRTLIARQDIRIGEKFTEKNLARLRPGIGIPCKYFDQVLGQVATVALKKGDPIQMGMWAST